jgi:hypothetical protein
MLRAESRHGFERQADYPAIQAMHVGSRLAVRPHDARGPRAHLDRFGHRTDLPGHKRLRRRHRLLLLEYVGLVVQNDRQMVQHRSFVANGILRATAIG